MSDTTDPWLASTEFIDHEHPDVQSYAAEVVGTTTDPREQAVKLFYAIRDGFWYDPYADDGERASFKASQVVATDRNWCVPKSILLTACARAVGIQARLGFADVRNHLQSEKLREKMGTDLFVFHGFSEFLLDGTWVKASPAFNLEMCERFDTKPLEFDGYNDALFHEFDKKGNRHMEYVHQRGSYDEFPYDEMKAVFAEVYPADLADDGSDAAFAKP